jgi:hypothetical protein
MFLIGVPQPVAIATTTTNRKGCFRFFTTKDRGRFLTIRLSGHLPTDFRSNCGYSVERLQDSLSPTSPLIGFDARLIHQPGGGFASTP